MNRIDFVVFAKPQPQGSSSAYVRGGRVVVTSSNKKLKPYRKLVAAEARESAYALGHDVDERGPVFGKHVPVRIIATFAFLHPPSAPKSRMHPVVLPDADKCARGLLDALTGIIWNDDAQVVEMFVRKVYGPVEGVSVVVQRITKEKTA